MNLLKKMGEFKTLPYLKNFSLFILVLSFSACKEETKLSPLAERGKIVYISNCIACHNQDPRLQGSIGPDVANSSLELITKRLLERSYPANYKPKRETQVMPDFPQLKNDIPAIHAYLNSFKK